MSHHLPTHKPLQAQNDGFPISVEQYVCPNEACDSSIPQSSVFSDYPDKRRAVETRRVITARCPNCLAVWRRTFVLRAARWEPLGNVERVTDGRTLKSIADRVKQTTTIAFAQSA